MRRQLNHVRLVLMLLLAGTATLTTLSAGAGGWPPQARLFRDVERHANKQWPGRKVGYVKKLGDCQKVGPEQLPEQLSGNKSPRGFCFVTADIYFEHGYRYDIHRGSRVFYRKRRLQAVELGELQRAWKEGGMPAPTPEEITTLLQAAYSGVDGITKASVEVMETGRPRPHGDVYRLTVVAKVHLGRQDGSSQQLDKMLLILESEGSQWQVAPQHLLPPGK